MMLFTLKHSRTYAAACMLQNYGMKQAELIANSIDGDAFATNKLSPFLANLYSRNTLKI